MIESVRVTMSPNEVTSSPKLKFKGEKYEEIRRLRVSNANVDAISESRRVCCNAKTKSGSKLARRIL